MYFIGDSCDLGLPVQSWFHMHYCINQVVLWIKRVGLDHEDIIRKETACQQMLQTAEADRQERHKVLNRAQAQIMTNIVLQKEKTRIKTTRNAKYDDNLEERRPKKPLLEKVRKKNQKEKDTSETLATMDFVKVSKRKKKRTKKKRKQVGRTREPQDSRLPVPERRGLQLIPSL